MANHPLMPACAPFGRTSRRATWTYHAKMANAKATPVGLEGIVAKRRDSRYRSGRCREWIKIKNPAHPAIERAMLIALSKRVRR